MRLCYYEGVLVAEGVRWHAVLWTLAGLAWSDDGSLTPSLLLVFAAFFLPGLLVGLYAARFKVRSRPGGRTRASTSRVVLHVAPVVAFVAGLLSAHAGTDGFLWRVGAGLAVGVAVVALTEYVLGRTRRGHADGDEER